MSFSSRIFRLFAGLLTVILPSLAAAQSSYAAYSSEAPPRKGTTSAWAIVNFVHPQETHAGNAAGFDGGIDYYFCRHVSGGIAVGFWRASLEGSHVNETYLDAEAAHHFVAGSRIDPYVQAGIGAYRTDSGSIGGSGTTRLGGFGGGGVVILLNRTFAVELAARYHVAHAAEGVHGNFWEAGGGLRLYF